MLYVKVNATSANVCVGFDVLGLALDWPNVFSFEETDEFEFSGFEPRYCNKENNMVYYAYIKTFEYAKRRPIPVKIGFKGDIPLSRGLGSSSSLIVGGVFGANQMMDNILTKEDCLNICCEIEGHPDNVAPAIYGGLVASFKNEEGYRSIAYPVSDELKFIAVVPPYKISTNEARKVLPKALPYKDIVSNLSRIINIPKAFELGDVSLLVDLFEDRVHEPYRSKLISKYDSIKKLCIENKAACAISGSGSTILIVCKELSIIDKLQSFGYEVRCLNIGEGVTVWED